MSSQLTLSQTAKLLKVSEKSIRRYIKAGRLNAKMIRGQKGEEYRINKSDLVRFSKPPRGKRAHKKTLRRSAPQIKKIRVTKPIKKISSSQLTPIGQIIKESAPQILSLSQNQHELINYRALYENLLAKYEQCLIMIGSLEAQLSNSSPIRYDEKIRRLEEATARQEDLILELYQIIQFQEKKKSIL